MTHPYSLPGHEVGAFLTALCGARGRVIVNLGKCNACGAEDLIFQAQREMGWRDQASGQPCASPGCDGKYVEVLPTEDPKGE
jgi:hypothetical protein